MFNKILLASDGSEHAIRAAEKALLLAGNNPNASIDIVYVVDGDKSKADVLHNWNSIDIDQKRKEKLTFTEQKVKRAGVDYQIKVIHGEPGPSIVKYANQNDFDVCVIGSRGLNSLQEMVLGSVSHKVAKRANCPVLIVK
ncbi:universal stress protein [Sediminibacillus albus]|uniref:Nucleotide-binding universal stress protein, UspA family n=1 Tax=Sediminibacillus albus TaxID=407036 RepID=A0A1G8YWE7_9BACI|nr:universal stress protein [Sediminibacillus albus]SDK06754.1 Nucleotide-binding universal stress protein, UspA family [Sediminibacillus albus]